MYISTSTQAKAKYNAWKKVADKETSPEDAQKEYVQKVESLKEKYGMNEWTNERVSECGGEEERDVDGIGWNM